MQVLTLTLCPRPTAGRRTKRGGRLRTMGWVGGACTPADCGQEAGLPCHLLGAKELTNGDIRAVWSVVFTEDRARAHRRQRELQVNVLPAVTTQARREIGSLWVKVPEAPCVCFREPQGKRSRTRICLFWGQRPGAELLSRPRMGSRAWDSDSEPFELGVSAF